MIKVILVDDHRVIRSGLKALLENEPSITVVGEAENGQELIDLLQTTPVDVVVMDIKMPQMDGYEATRYVTNNFNSIKVLALSMFEAENYINRMLEEGAQGYILKNISREELIHAIQMIANGQHYISAEISINLLKRKTEAPEVAVTHSPRTGVELVELSKRELEVLKLITDGLTNAEIADKLFTSKRTIDSHRQRIIEKTQAKNTAALVKFAMLKGIIQ